MPIKLGISSIFVEMGGLDNFDPSATGLKTAGIDTGFTTAIRYQTGKQDHYYYNVSDGESSM